MADSIPDQSSPSSNEDLRSEVAELRAMLNALKGQLQQSEDKAVRRAIESINIQAGNHCTISGNNGNYTIHVEWPTTGQINGTLQCGEDGNPAVLTGSVTF